MIDKEIPIPRKDLEENQYSFSSQQTYLLCLKRVCVVCGKRAELHHVDAIGMGNDRRKISHIGKRVLPLCREEHHKEAHTIGNDLYVVSCNDFNRYWYNIKTNEVTPIDHHMDIPQEIIDEIKDMGYRFIHK